MTLVDIAKVTGLAVAETSRCGRRLVGLSQTAGAERGHCQHAGGDAGRCESIHRQYTSGRTG